MEPYKPTTAIVDKGPFAYSRNPLYLCMFVVYLGIALLTGNAWLLLLAVPLFFIMHYGVIAREERYLERQIRRDLSRLQAPRAPLAVAPKHSRWFDSTHLVMPGLDPGIHHSTGPASRIRMDRRVKHGDDNDG